MQSLHSPLIETQFQNNNIQIQTREIDLPLSEILPYLDPKEFNSYCQTGCNNYSQKWTCPPHCPSFLDYAADYSHIRLVLYHTVCEQFAFIQAEDRALTAYNFSKDELQRSLRDRETEEDKFIGPNSCEMCTVCKAASADACHLPHLIRYNLVAFGFNVTKIMEEIFEHKLQWAKAGEVPEHVSSIGALLIKK